VAIIHYSVSGEGRGHASRARVLIDRLRPYHRVVVHCYGDAEAILAPLYSGTDVLVRSIPGLRFAYDRRGRLRRAASVVQALPFLWQLRDETRYLARLLEADQADLALVDFEPLLPRAARLAGVPVMAVDHQQFLTACDLSSLPWQLRSGATLLAQFVRAFYGGPLPSVISSFFSPPLRRQARQVVQAGVLLRREFLELTPRDGSYLVAYLRRHPPESVLSALLYCGHPVRVYGAAETGTWANLSFKPLRADGFAEDLAGSLGLVTTAGNQVIGEALSLEKPVLAYPEPGNIEQSINAHFINALGVGRAVPAPQLTPELVADFVRHAPAFARRIDARRIDGSAVVLRAIEAQLEGLPLLPAQRPERAQLGPAVGLARPAISPRPGPA
jgi:uncharacterized protein (TIGR00661 family)